MAGDEGRLGWSVRTAASLRRTNRAGRSGRGHLSPGRWLLRRKQLTHWQSLFGGQASAGDLLGAQRSGLVAGHLFHHVETTAGGAPLCGCCLPVMCILNWMYLGGEVES